MTRGLARTTVIYSAHAFGICQLLGHSEREAMVPHLRLPAKTWVSKLKRLAPDPVKASNRSRHHRGPTPTSLAKQYCTLLDYSTDFCRFEYITAALNALRRYSTPLWASSPTSVSTVIRSQSKVSFHCIFRPSRLSLFPSTSELCSHRRGISRRLSGCSPDGQGLALRATVFSLLRTIRTQSGLLPINVHVFIPVALDKQVKEENLFRFQRCISLLFSYRGSTVLELLVAEESSVCSTWDSAMSRLQFCAVSIRRPC